MAKRRKKQTAKDASLAGQPGWQPVPGVTLRLTLRGHKDWIGRIAWSPDGKWLASPSNDKTIRIWDAVTGKVVRTLAGHTNTVYSVAWSPDGRRLASASDDQTVRLWDIETGQDLRTLKGHSGGVNSVAWSPDGRRLASASDDATIRLWDAETGQALRTLAGHSHQLNSVAWSPDGRRLASASSDKTVRLWDAETGQALRTLKGHSERIFSVAWWPELGVPRLASASGDKTIRLWDAETGLATNVLEGHTGAMRCAAFAPDARLIASNGGSGDNTVRLWRCDTWQPVAVIPEPASRVWPPDVAFHPHEPVLATVGSDPGTKDDDCDRLIHIWQLDYAVLLGQPVRPSVSYTSAKVVLVGDTGVGKSGLSLVLNKQRFEATESTPGRRVSTLDSKVAIPSHNISQIQETLLWDLAGQPGYRVIHQLHLNEVAVALVVFDARSETDPLSGVRHWERALRLAHQRQGSGGVPMRKFLVSARNDRGVVSVSKERLQALMEEYKFDGFFETSAKEGWQIAELRTAIEQSIPWELLPAVSSSQLFADIKAFLVRVKESGRLLAMPEQLFDDFVTQQPEAGKDLADLRAQFDTCIGRIEARDLIRRLTFGGYVLLQPELLDAYASAMVNTAKEEPDGLGSLAEEIALGGRFFVPDEQKIKDAGQEQLLLHATVEELVRHDLALRENADDGRYLVFPSQFNRDFEDAPEPPGKAVAITFDGPVQSLYATLAVRLGHSGLFSTGRAEMWRNAAIFTAKAGGKCGLFVNEFSEGRGRLILFYDKQASPETQFHFEEYVLAHAARRSLQDSVSLVRFFVCPGCGEPVPDAYVKTLRAKGKNSFDCPCGGAVSLAEPKERIQFKSAVQEMDNSADRQRNFDAFVMSAKGETSTESFHKWAGGERVTLAIVFTDVVGSTAMGEEMRDESMNEVRRSHFAQSRSLIDKFKGREIKTIGDSFMVAFKSVDAALDYARGLQGNTGHRSIKIRAGIHIGPMHVEESDVFGGTVNFAARVVGAIKDAEVWLSDRAKDDIDRLGAGTHKSLKWERQEEVTMKGFPGTWTLWAVRSARE